MLTWGDEFMSTPSIITFLTNPLLFDNEKRPRISNPTP